MNGNTYNSIDIEFYGSYYPLLKEAINKITSFINEYSETAVNSGRRDPIEHIKSRIKSYSAQKQNFQTDVSGLSKCDNSDSRRCGSKSGMYFYR